MATRPIQFPKLKVAYLSQCILETGRGNSFLFQQAGNPTGMKWRPEMRGFAEQTFLVTPTEPNGAEWCLWQKPEDAVNGYWQFISRPVYSGWERFGDNPKGYLKHIWECGYATDPKYVEKVTSLFSEAQDLLKDAGSIEMANWILFNRADDGSPLVSAMSGAAVTEQLKGPQKENLINFLKRFDGADTFSVAPGNGQISEQDATTLDKVDLRGNVNWYQFFREVTGKPAVVAMNDSNSISILRSNRKDDLISFLNKYSGANTFQIASVGTSVVIPPRNLERAIKPSVRWVSGCPHFSSRTGAAITSIVVHYTTSRNINGTISWFKDPRSRVSAHYIVGRDGEIVQMVRDSDKAWHCLNFNNNSIGIEHVAAEGDKLTLEQEKASAALIKWLMAEYKVPVKNVFGHRWNPNTPNETSCPGSLWLSQFDLQEWLKNKVVG
ncbi:MAG: N-acetylmuramoyl-L-alanine amidase [Desertifilum sp.]|nr:N-acetylmuramoyl-L-alanine amidase [Desertifilum sp.]